ncbi:MAG: C1 family peptidase, partial [Pseudomonadota bacterium]
TRCYNPFDLVFADLMAINEPPGGHDTHAIQVVDYIVDEDGKPLWILLKNTWGESKGDVGYFHVDWESFQYLTLRLTVPQMYVVM